jgi:hypothetical protein
LFPMCFPVSCVLSSSHFIFMLLLNHFLIFSFFIFFKNCLIFFNETLLIINKPNHPKKGTQGTKGKDPHSN